MKHNNSKDRELSSITYKSQQILQQIASKSMSKISKIHGFFNDSDQLRNAWTAFGLYISKNLRNGRGIHINKFGTFTFSAPQFKLEGVTNPLSRDLQPRFPVFLIFKDFVLGKTIKSGIFFNKKISLGIRPYNQFATTGQIPIVKLNYAQISVYAKMSKNGFQLALHRIIKHLSDEVLKKGNCSIQIPHVGFLYINNGIAGVKFMEILQNQTRTISNQSVRNKKQKTGLTVENLKKLQQQNNYNNKTINFLDKKVKQYLKADYGINLNDDKKKIGKEVTFGKVQILQKNNPKKELQQQIRNAMAEQFMTLIKNQIFRSNVKKQDLKSKLQTYDENGSGYIQQNQLKQILSQFNINLTLSDLIHLVKIIKIDKKNRINYNDLLNKIYQKPGTKQQYRIDIVKKIRQWFINQPQKTILMAFKIIDHNHDSYIDQKDLSTFLITTLKFNSTQLTSIRLQNVIDQADIYKIGKIDLVCFSRMMNSNNQYNKDWIYKQKNHISMQLIRRFQNSNKAFIYISKSNIKLNYLNFKNWLLQNKIIDNQGLIVQILFDIDTNKKGYFLENQFTKIFYNFNWKNQIVLALLENLQKIYITSKQAYLSLCHYKQLDYLQFISVMQNILKNKYTKEQLTQVWYKFAGSDQIITWDRWNKMISDWKYKPEVNRRNKQDLQSQQQNRLIKLVSKNRKYLLKKFQQLNQQNKQIQLSIIKRVVKQMISQENTKFEQQVYDKYLGINGNKQKINYKDMLQNLKTKGYLLVDFPKNFKQ